ncbi:hypothetical protein, partial [Sinorhizobium sp. 6-117]|uniref:hypothetical protein n=1 Tax=Sinorhizobium sp. 6-117 TaxID=3049090 RepID=UPI0024C227AB
RLLVSDSHDPGRPGVSATRSHRKSPDVLPSDQEGVGQEFVGNSLSVRAQMLNDVGHMLSNTNAGKAA